MRRLLVLVSGPPGAGKTTIARRLSKELGVPLFAKDDIKESLFDSLGYSDREWSKRLGAATWELVFLFMERHAGTAAIFESNFYPDEHRARIAGFGCPVVEVHCVADPDVLSARFHSRDRHPGHTREEPYTPADAARALVLNGALEIGPVVEVDTTYPDRIDWNELMEHVRKEMGDTGGSQDS